MVAALRIAAALAALVGLGAALSALGDTEATGGALFAFLTVAGPGLFAAAVLAGLAQVVENTAPPGAGSGGRAG